MRQIQNITDYLLLDGGAVMEQDTLDEVQLTSKGNYKLLTDEKVWLDTKQKHIRLWRRFTVEDIIKMYNSSSSYEANLDGVGTDSCVPVRGQVECTSGTSSSNGVGQVVESGQVGTTKRGTSAQVCINGTTYKSINDAATQLSLNRKVVKKRLDDDSNHDYTYID